MIESGFSTPTGRPFLGEGEFGVLVEVTLQSNEIGLQTGDRLA